MIEYDDLIDLGYKVKTFLDDSIDFMHEDFDNRPYLANLQEGRVTIVPPVNRKEIPRFMTKDPDEFRAWHLNFHL